MLLSEETASGVALVWAIGGNGSDVCVSFWCFRRKHDTGPTTHIRVGTQVETERISRENPCVET